MHDHDQGLAHDLEKLHGQRLQRRQALRWLAGAGSLGLGAFGLLACGGGGDDDASATTPSTTGSSATDSTTGAGGSSACTVIPEETAGPYPGDGSNSAGGSIANALALSGIVRSDIRSSIAGATGMADGVPLVLTLELVNTGASCADLAGYAVYLWHCDREGRYSMYSSGVTAENYLRGVQETGSDGAARFTTIFPGCYAGRMPHMHFEIYRNANSRKRLEQQAAHLADRLSGGRQQHGLQRRRRLRDERRQPGAHQLRERQRLQRRREQPARHDHGQRGGRLRGHTARRHLGLAHARGGGRGIASRPWPPAATRRRA